LVPFSLNLWLKRSGCFLALRLITVLTGFLSLRKKDAYEILHMAVVVLGPKHVTVPLSVLWNRKVSQSVEDRSYSLDLEELLFHGLTLTKECHWTT
jgi:hypothetical protein